METTSIGELLNPVAIYQRLSDIYHQLPIDPRISEDIRDKITKKDKKFPDKATLMIDSSYRGSDTYRVDVGYGRDNYLAFELTPEGLSYLDYRYSINIGDATLANTERMWSAFRSHQTGKINPDSNGVAKALVDWVGELAQSDAFIQPPVAVKLAP